MTDLTNVKILETQIKLLIHKARGSLHQYMDALNEAGPLAEQTLEDFKYQYGNTARNRKTNSSTEEPTPEKI